MIRWVFGIAGLLVALGLFFALRYGVAPRAIPLIKATEVESLEQAGVLVYRRLRQDIRSGDAILAGSFPMLKNYENFWQGFVLGSQNDGAPLGHVFTVNGMTLFPESRVLQVEELSLDEIRKKAISKDRPSRELFYLPTTLVTHLFSDSISKSMDHEKIKKVSITLHEFSLAEDQIEKLRNSCPAGSEESLLKKLDCLSLKVVQDNYRKRPDPSKRYITLYRYGLSDYIAYWHSPDR